MYEKLEAIEQEIGKVIKGKKDVIKKVLMAICASGHVLLEDHPGSGKTTLAKAIAKAMELDYNRQQFTPDTMPSDIIGYSFYNKQKEEFQYVPGVVQCNLLLGDEINRTSSKTQSALLEAMEEKTVTVDGNTMALPDPFIVIATQNPITSGGTQPLPDSQCDRFMVRLSMGYPAFEDEVTILRENSDEDAMQQIHQIATKEDLYRIKEQIAKVVVKDQILEYICRLCEATRSHDEIERGVSTRGAIAVKRMAMANAAFHERNYVIPKDVEEIFIDVCAHRIICNARAKIEENSEQHILQRILEQITPPSLFQ